MLYTVGFYQDDGFASIITCYLYTQWNPNPRTDHTLTHTRLTGGGSLHGYERAPRLNSCWNNSHYLTNIVSSRPAPLKPIKSGERLGSLSPRHRMKQCNQDKLGWRHSTELRGQTWHLVDLNVLGLTYMWAARGRDEGIIGFPPTTHKKMFCHSLNVLTLSIKQICHIYTIHVTGDIHFHKSFVNFFCSSL